MRGFAVVVVASAALLSLSGCGDDEEKKRAYATLELAWDIGETSTHQSLCDYLDEFGADAVVEKLRSASADEKRVLSAKEEAEWYENKCAELAVFGP